MNHFLESIGVEYADQHDDVKDGNNGALRRSPETKVLHFAVEPDKLEDRDDDDSHDKKSTFYIGEIDYWKSLRKGPRSPHTSEHQVGCEHGNKWHSRQNLALPLFQEQREMNIISK